MSTLIADKLKSRNTGTAVSVTDSLIIVGYGTVTEDLSVEGDLNVTGDLVYDEATAVNLNVTGIATIGTLGVTGVATAYNLEVIGVTTTGTAKIGSGVTISVAGVDAVSGVITATSAQITSAQISDLTNNRVVIAGTNGELEDSSNLTFNGSTLEVTGAVTATSSIVGAAVTTHNKGIDVAGIVTATGGFSGTASLASGLTGTPSITVQDVTAQMVSVAGTMQYEDVVNVDSAGIGTFKGGLDVVGSAVTIHNAGVHVTGVVTATSFVGDGSSLTNLPGNPFTDNVGVQTANITRTDLVGAGNSFVGMYLGDGFIGFPTHLGRPGGYYITTAVNALNAGPITLGSTMTLDGAWVIV